MTDRTKEHLVLYKKDGSKVAEGKVGEKTIVLTGLAAGTTVAAGDYLVAWSDGTQESANKIAVPAFTIPAAKPEDPANVTVKVNDDGSVSISAE